MSIRESDLDHSANTSPVHATAATRCVDFIQSLLLRSHSALFYIDKFEKHWLTLKFIHSALFRGHQVQYYTHRDETDYSKELMRIYGIKVPQYERRGQLRVLPSNEFYLDRCGADKDMIIGELGRISSRARVNGFKGTFIAGDMSCFLDEGLEDELIDYEQSLGRKLPVDVAELCLYDSLQLSKMSEIFKTNLVRAHSSLVLSSDIVELGSPDSGRETFALSLLQGGARRWSTGEAEVVSGRLVAMDRGRSYVVMDVVRGGDRVSWRCSLEGWTGESKSELLLHLGEELEAEVEDGLLITYKV